MDQTVIQYLSDPQSWLNTGFAVQTALVLMLVVGGLIALPDRITNRIMAKDGFGRFLFIIGLIFTMLFVVPAILPAIVGIGWVGGAFIVIVIVLLIVRFVAR